MVNRVRQAAQTSSAEVFVEPIMRKGGLPCGGRLADVELAQTVGPGIACVLAVSSDKDFVLRERAFRKLVAESGRPAALTSLTDVAKTVYAHTLARNQKIIPSPFMVYKPEAYNEVDIFTEETGVGPLPVTSDTFKQAETLAVDGRGRRVVSRAYLIASFINAIAYTDERARRAFLLLFDAAERNGEKATVDELITPIALLIRDSCTRFEEVRREKGGGYAVFRDKRFHDIHAYTREKLPLRLENDRCKNIRIAERFWKHSAPVNEKIVAALCGQLRRAV